MNDFLRAASKEHRYRNGGYSDVDYWIVRLGSWNDLERRARNCSLCGAILSLLYEKGSRKAILSRNRHTVDIDCALYINPHEYRHYIRHGYYRIGIKLDIGERSDIFPDGIPDVIALEDAFQVSENLLRVPEMNMRFQQTARTTAPRPRLRPEICNSDIVNNWLKFCRDNHGDRCTAYSRKPTATIRLVDVYAGTVLPFAQSGHSKIPPYVSLSWVWGLARAGDGMTSARLTDASKEGFLESLQLPVTVSDAIMFLQRLGIHYLWVDLLCIVQDNTVDKEFYIPLMGSIYAASEFTIIANGKNGAFDGLPGVRAARRPTQRVVNTHELILVSGLDARLDRFAEVEKEDTPWTNRAWTLQEKLLSQRCLIFGSNQMYWECLEASYCEETGFETIKNGTYPVPHMGKSLFNRIQSGEKPQEFQDQYSSLVYLYSPRALSFDSDALHAFQGILNMLSDLTGIQFLWGLPTLLFEQNLLWSAVPGNKRSHQGFPSWSWVNYRCAKPVSEPLYGDNTVAIRCYRRTNELLDEGNNDIFLQPIPYETPYRPYHRQGDSRIVDINDIPVTVRRDIKPNFHLLFWADTARVRWFRSSHRTDHGGLYIPIGEGDELMTRIMEAVPNAIIRDRKNQANLFMGDAEIDQYYHNGQSQMDCQLVGVLDQLQKRYGKLYSL